MIPITDPDLINQLESAPALKPVTDPDLLQRLNAEETEEQESVDFSFTETIGNIPGSAVQLAKDIYHPIRHPIDTAKSLQTIGQGLIEKIIPDVGEFGPTENEKVVDAVGQFIKDRYGSINAFKTTVQNDPVGALADFSIVATGGGTALVRAGKVAKVAEAGKFAKVAKTVQAVGKATEPINAVINFAKVAGKLVPQGLPEKLLESALKFRPSIKPAERARMVKTALKEGILPTVAGLMDLSDKLEVLDIGLNKIIDQATKKGTLINKSIVFKQLKELRKDLGGTKLDAGVDLKHIDAVAKSFNEHLKKIKKDKLTPRELQTLKTDAYKRINFDLQQGSASFAKNETRRAIARAAKESLEELGPDVKSLNREMGDLIQLRGELERVVARLDNQNLISIGTPLKVGTGTLIAGETGAAVGVAASILGAPRVKARIALWLENIREISELKNLINKKLPPVLVSQMLLLAGRTDQALRSELDREIQESQ